MSRNTWSIVKNVGIVVAIVLAMTQIWDWMGRPSDSLEMELRFGDFHIPPVLTDDSDRLYDLLDPEKIASEIELGEILRPRTRHDLPSVFL